MTVKNIEINYKTNVGFDQFLPRNRADIVFYDNTATGYTSETIQGAVDITNRIVPITIPLSGWSATLVNGWYTNQVNVTNMNAKLNPIVSCNITSSATAEAQTEAFGLIKEIETFNGYIIARVLEKPTIDIPINIKGV